MGKMAQQLQLYFGDQNFDCAFDLGGVLSYPSVRTNLVIEQSEPWTAPVPALRITFDHFEGIYAKLPYIGPVETRSVGLRDLVKTRFGQRLDHRHYPDLVVLEFLSNYSIMGSSYYDATLMIQLCALLSMDPIPRFNTYPLESMHSRIARTTLVDHMLFGSEIPRQFWSEAFTMENPPVRPPPYAHDPCNIQNALKAISVSLECESRPRLS